MPPMPATGPSSHPIDNPWDSYVLELQAHPKTAENMRLLQDALALQLSWQREQLSWQREQLSWQREQEERQKESQRKAALEAEEVKMRMELWESLAPKRQQIIEQTPPSRVVAELNRLLRGYREECGGAHVVRPCRWPGRPGRETRGGNAVTSPPWCTTLAFPWVVQNASACCEHNMKLCLGSWEVSAPLCCRAELCPAGRLTPCPSVPGEGKGPLYSGGWPGWLWRMLGLSGWGRVPWGPHDKAE